MRGFVHCYTGNGKGKTTAALGLSLRAAGHGKKVLIIQFMKGNIEYGELNGIKMLSPYAVIKQFGRESFVSKDNPEQTDIELAVKGLLYAKEKIESDEYDIIVLDEINVAIDFKLIELEKVIKIIKNKPERLELILTGRYADKKILELCDLITEMKEVKHYYYNNITGRQGIEY
jgi:cob(I)alamin adenosyltransferase